MPKTFDRFTSIAAPIIRSDVDTDVIIRIERLVGNSVRGTLGKWAFGSLRYLPDGSENPEFVLNREPGRLIIESKARGEASGMMVDVIVLTLVGVVLSAMIWRLQAYLLRWQRHHMVE